MTLVSNKEAQKIFLTTNTDTKAITLSNKIDIIISPEFYWVRKFEIPVKTETQARHVLPTLFEDIIADTVTLTYQVIKLDENIFLCFAYNNKKIYDAIKKLNISVSSINAFYFAQNECQNFKAFEIDNQKYIYTNEGILVKVPSNLIEDAIPLKKVINNVELSSYKLQMKLYNDVIDSKFYYAFFIIFSVLILTNVIKYFNYDNEINKLEEKILKVKTENNLPTSIIQTNSILKKYNLNNIKEKKKREAIAYIFANSKFDLKSLFFQNNEIELEYLSVDKSSVDNYLSKKFKIISSKANSFSLKVRLKI